MYFSFHIPRYCLPSLFFFFNDTATTEIYTPSLHDALPISLESAACESPMKPTSSTGPAMRRLVYSARRRAKRSEEHTSELQSQSNLVCRLLLEKKKKKHESSSAMRDLC